MLSYTPSSTGWIVLARPEMALAVDLQSDDVRVPRLWELMGAKAQPTALLDELSGGGISKTPNFAMVAITVTGAVALTVRGVVAELVSGGKAEIASGVDVSSWTDRSFSGFSSIDLKFAAKIPGAALPLNDGVVRASRLAITGGEVVDASPAVTAVRAVKRPAASSADPEETLTAATTTSLEPVGALDSTASEAGSEEPANEPSGYDHLFGQTEIRTDEGAPVREVREGEQDAIEDATVVVAELATFRAQRRAARASAKAPPPPPNFALELSTGEREPLEHSVIVGRAPSVTRVSGGNVPRLITLTNELQDLSRSHVQVSVEGGTVVVTDLHSRNGTFVTLPNRLPQKLRAGEPTAVIAGTVIDLGGGAMLTVVAN